MNKVQLIFILLLRLSILASGKEINIGLTGDITFDGLVKKSIDKYGKSTVFEGYREEFTKCDMVFANLETTITTGGDKIGYKKYTFRSSPDMLTELKKNKIYAVSIANNHIVDYGLSGFYDTLNNLKKYGIYYSGAGKNYEDSNIFPVVEKKGIKIGFIAFSHVIPYREWNVDVDRPGIKGIYPQHQKEVMALIQSAKSKCDILIVSVHWGKERSLEPSSYQRKLAKKIIDSGADIVMGHHTHTVQEMEYYKGKPIFYSLGNFIFGNAVTKAANETVMGVVTVNDSGKIIKVKLKRGKIIESMPLCYDGKKYKEYIKMKNELLVSGNIKKEDKLKTLSNLKKVSNYDKM